MNKQKLTVKDHCFIGIFAAIICVLGQLSIPMPYGVPMTLQTFVIPLAGVVLGAKKGTLATIIYVLLGTIGLPVFAGFSGGIGIVLGSTGGFILSFPIMALAAGLGADSGKKIWLILGLVIGAIINYLCGMLMFSVITASTLNTAFIVCVLPFILTSIIKMVLVYIGGLNIKKRMNKADLVK